MELTLQEAVKLYGDRKINKEELEKLLLPEEPKTMWNIKVGERYWFLSEGGTVRESHWDGDGVDLGRRLNNNVFRNDGLAHKRLRENEVASIIAKYETPVNEFDWISSVTTNKYTFYAGTVGSVWALFKTVNSVNLMNKHYFKTDELRQKAIDEVGEQRLIKYLTGTL